MTQHYYPDQGFHDLSYFYAQIPVILIRLQKLHSKVISN
jgi:hypothetical protein